MKYKIKTAIKVITIHNIIQKKLYGSPNINGYALFPKVNIGNKTVENNNVLMMI
ncbi:hypothetical protein HMPREF9372_1096 [Sporosarcina newyorkensis 2681]|uniref:Uncharacterized protein n=1 Tax=Sporosarcina newyorkensis 2681 TaxID=1027292 RepID=F9DQK7_9BACL|nr:hypothetical protein HMPREF9372_1096 [Sporosarcina newyorkensis 2681]